MAGVGTGLTVPGIRANFFERYTEVRKQTVYEELSTRLPSTTKKESYGFLGSVPPMREWGTGRLVQGIYAETYDVTNAKYELTLEVDRDEIDDDQTGQIMIRVREMAQRAAHHKDAEIARLLVNGATAGYHSYDGVPFFGSTHPIRKTGGTQDNDLTAAIVDKDACTAAEFRSALTQGIVALLGFKDDQNEPMSMGATGLVCVVPPNMLIPASEAVNASIISSTDNVLKGAARVLSFSHLTATDAWYLLKTDVSVRPFIFQDRQDVEFTALERDTDEGFKRDKYLYGVRARYRMTYGYWQYALRFVFTTA
ncbi:MAG: Mu-like prophage major head subunit gpT family protein [Phycisphaerae bacterium]|jgi:phage major head subunit gpT-like protein